MELRSKRYVKVPQVLEYGSSTSSEEFPPQLQQRSKLKFDSPDETEKWLSTREKTDYTYSRSTSYTAIGSPSHYDTPIMSRLSQGPFLRGSPMRRGVHVQQQQLLQQQQQQHEQQEMSDSSSRRSSRLAKRNDSMLSSSRMNQSHNRSVQVSRHTSREEYDHGDSFLTSAESSIISSASHQPATRRAPQGHQPGGNRVHSVNYMYGLDANEESELSDTESSSAVTSRLGLAYSERSHKEPPSFTHQHSHNHSAETHRDTSAVLVFLYSIVNIITTVTSVLVTVVNTSASSTSSAVWGSKVTTVPTGGAAATRSWSSSIVSLFSSLGRTISAFVYRCVTYLMCLDVWWLIFIRRSTLGVLGSVASLLGLSASNQLTSAAILEKKRKRRSCCLCLFLLLGSVASSYLLLAAAPMIMSALSSNETKIVTPSTDEQLALLLGKLSGGGDEMGGSAAMATGCIQCLKQEDLRSLIGIIVKGQLHDLQTEVASQTRQIAAMHQLRSGQDIHISSLQEQINVLLAQQGRPDDRTLLHMNSIEGQLTRVRGQLRNLHLSRLRGQQQQQQSESERLESSEIVAVLRYDLNVLSGEVSGLQSELGDLSAKHSQDAQLLHVGDENLRRDLNILISREERFAVNMTFLEAKLAGLVRDAEVLGTSDRRGSAELVEMVDRVNSFEDSFAGLRMGLRRLESEFAEGLSLRDRVEREREATVDSSLELFRKEIQVGSQALEKSVDGVRTNVHRLQTAVEDLGARQLGAVVAKVEQLNSKLSIVDEDFVSLRADFETMQGAGTGDGLSGLIVRAGQTGERLNSFTAEVDSLKSQVSLLRIRVDDVGASQDEHRAEAGAAMKRLNVAIAELDIKAQRRVVVESNQGSADANVLVGHLSQELDSIRKDLGQLSSLHGESDLVAKLDHFEATLVGVRSRLEQLDAAHVRLAQSLSSGASDLGLQIGRIDGSVTDQAATIVGLRSAVATLEKGWIKIEAVAKRASMQDLSLEMTNLRGRIAELATVQEGYASGDDVESLRSRLTGVKLHLELAQRRLDDVSGTYAAGSKAYPALAGDLASLRETVRELEAMLCDADRGPVDLILLESRVGSLTSFLGGKSAENLSAFLAAGGIVTSHDALAVTQRDIAAVRADIDRLSSSLLVANGDAVSGVAAAAVLHRVVTLESSMKTLGAGAGGLLEHRYQHLQDDINSLKEEIIRQKLLHSQSGGGAGLGAVFVSDMNEVKTNLTRLQVDVHECCRNKSGLMGWWGSPWFSKGQGSSGSTLNLSADAHMDDERVKHIVLSALNMYSADKTGMVDYALESAGGSVISTRCAETHYSKTALLSIFGVPLWYMANSPRTVIQPDVQPGNCWAFKGSQGFMVIQLAGIIKPSAFSLEHIPKSLSPTGTIDSAPKQFSVWGLESEEEIEGTLLGEYSYDQDGPPLQFFPLERVDVQPIPAVELKIHSNHGNLEYTCLYRFRVHGTLHKR